MVQRLKAYDLQTTPVLEFLGQAGYKCFDVRGEGRAPQVIAREIQDLIESEFGAANA